MGVAHHLTRRYAFLRKIQYDHLIILYIGTPMINGNAPIQRKKSLAALVVEHLISLGFDAQIEVSRVNSAAHSDQVLVSCKQLGLIHLTATSNTDSEASILVSDFEGDQRYLADKKYVVYGWNHDTGASIYFVDSGLVKGRKHFKKSEIRANSLDSLNAQIRPQA